MFRRIRIAVLLYVLLFVAVSQYLTQRNSRAWDVPLWVDVYPIAAGAAEATRSHVDALDEDSFAAIETFLAAEAKSYGVAVDQPFRLALAPPLDTAPPVPPDEPGIVGTLLWSLKLRWFTTRLVWTQDRPHPDIVLYALYHDNRPGRPLDDSRALRKGMIVFANLFASREAERGNHVVLAHELLHTVGATDKYDPTTLLPVYPHGYADPDLEPRFPQTRAELMAGRVPLGAGRAEQPAGLADVVIGPVTAAEIGWHDGS